MNTARTAPAGLSGFRFARAWLPAVVLGLALLAAYSNSFRTPFIFDDADSITRNPTLGRFSTALFPPRDSGITVSGRPILNLSFALNRALGGENVVGYHAANLAIHFLAALTLFGVVHRTLHLPRLREKFGFSPRLAAFGVAVVWALHPLQTESVTYLVQRAESLVGLFYLLTLYAFVWSLEVPPRSSGRWRAIAVGACLLGMASKEVMVSAPLLILFFDRTFVSGTFREAWRTRSRFYLLLASTWLVLAACLIASGGRGASVGTGGSVSVWQYALTQCHAVCLYLRLCLWPHPLVLDYGRYLAAGFGAVAWQALLLLALGLGTLFAFVRKSAVGFLGAFFFLILAPTSSVVPVIAQTMAEHRVYLPLAAVVALLVLGSWRWVGGWSLALWLAIAVSLGFVTFRRNQDYRSAQSIWADTAAKRPDNSRAWYCLGIELLTARREAEAVTAFSHSAKLDPGNPEVMIGYANALAATGEGERAIELYRVALDKLPRDYPMSYEAQHNLGVMLLGRGQTEEAVEHLRLAVELKPAAADSHFSLGNALAAAGHPDEALTQFETTLSIHPDSLPARVSLANLLIKLDRPTEAVPHYERAVALAPNDPQLQYALANSLLQSDRSAEASRVYEKLIEQAPDYVEAHNELGIAYAQLGRIGDARAQFETVLRLKPDHAGARENLARLKITPR